jgi:hypothetical protein
MKIVIVSGVSLITLEHCLECEKAQLDIFVDEGCKITVQKSNPNKSLKN